MLNNYRHDLETLVSLPDNKKLLLDISDKRKATVPMINKFYDTQNILIILAIIVFGPILLLLSPAIGPIFAIVWFFVIAEVSNKKINSKMIRLLYGKKDDPLKDFRNQPFINRKDSASGLYYSYIYDYENSPRISEERQVDFNSYFKELFQKDNTKNMIFNILEDRFKAAVELNENPYIAPTLFFQRIKSRERLSEIENLARKYLVDVIVVDYNKLGYSIYQ